MVNLGPNYQFDVLLRVLLFQVKKQEIYREVNWPRDALLPEINHGHRCHLWTPTDFGHHQSDIWNDENGLGIEFVTIVVWFRIRLSFNGNENQSTWDTESISIRTNVLAVATFTFRCEKKAYEDCWAANRYLLTHFISSAKDTRGFSSPFAIIFLWSWYWKASNHVLHFTHGQWRRQKPSCL